MYSLGYEMEGRGTAVSVPAVARGARVLQTFRKIAGADPAFSCLTLRRPMSYIYGAPILDVSRSHTTTQHSR